jgi:adenylate cyclase
MNIDLHSINILIDEIIERTLMSPIEPTLLHDSCEYLKKNGLSILRVNMSWGTLHPTVMASSLQWRHNQPPSEVERYLHQDDGSENWRNSPAFYCLENQLFHLHTSLEKRNPEFSFPVFDELKALGGTDYLIHLIPFSTEETGYHNKDGVFISWLSDRIGGFNDDEINIINRVQKHLALALKVAVRERITINTLTTYLGENAASRVLTGNIKLGDGEIIPAAIWYSDLRNSTHLGDTLSGPELLSTLNEYFACSAGAVTQNGGEVLRFIGDAVLAIFPSEKIGMAKACANATLAAHDAVNLLKAVNIKRLSEGKDTLDFGLGLHTGTLMYGNIGISDRLDFAVTGPAANETARIETMTKELGHPVLASYDFTQYAPSHWIALGRHPLRGVGRHLDLFALKL